MKKLFKITRESGIPLIGLVQIGVIDRGTNLLQVRPTSVCNLNCVYCSADAGSESRYRVTDYVAEVDYLVDWVREVVSFKAEHGCDKVEINLDSCGEIMTYPEIFELIKGISKIEGIAKISMQTNGTLLDEGKIKRLEELGVGQINLSMNSLDAKLCKKLSGCKWYDVRKIKEIAELINKSDIKLLIAPVWIPKVNDEGVIELIKLCKGLGCKIGIQKYEVHKNGRKVKGVRPVKYYKFYKQLEELEDEFKIKLKMGAVDFGVKKCKRIPYKFRKGETVEVVIKGPGWMRDEIIGVSANAGRNRALTVLNCNSRIG
ncbi:MAG: radical SAM protein, partial [Nanoarchaeota archaeon]|nr:radical SAM protein [Nanoarchaeota archaeon]